MSLQGWESRTRHTEKLEQRLASNSGNRKRALVLKIKFVLRIFKENGMQIHSETNTGQPFVQFFFFFKLWTYYEGKLWSTKMCLYNQILLVKVRMKEMPVCYIMHHKVSNLSYVNSLCNKNKSIVIKY